jgi:hypothetical protein
VCFELQCKVVVVLIPWLVAWQVLDEVADLCLLRYCKPDKGVLAAYGGGKGITPSKVSAANLITAR